MRTTWPRLAAFAVLTTFAATFTTSASAQSYPTKPIRFLVPFGPGGVGDLTARVVAQKLNTLLGQQVIIDNRPSAGGIVAAQLVANAEPDGYTMLLLNNQHAVSMAMFKSLPYDTLKDFQPVTSLGTFSMVLLVNPNSPLKSVKDLITSAKTNPAKLNIGTIPIGATQHLALELFRSMTGTNFVHVPYPNTGLVLAGLRGDSIQVAFEFVAPVMGNLKGGQFRALAVTTRHRNPDLPNVPTMEESGLPGYEVTSWNGIGVPAKTPRAIVDRLSKVANEALASADLKQRFNELSVEPFPSTPEAYRKHIAAEIAKWTKLVETAKIPKL